MDFGHPGRRQKEREGREYFRTGGRFLKEKRASTQKNVKLHQKETERGDQASDTKSGFDQKEFALWAIHADCNAQGKGMPAALQSP